MKGTTKSISSHPFTIACVTPLFFSVCFVFYFFPFLFHLLFSLSLTLIIGIFYCLNYISLLLYLIKTRFVSHFSFSSNFFTIFILLIGIFYSLNNTSLLLHLVVTHLVNTSYNKYVIKICPRKLL